MFEMVERSERVRYLSPEPKNSTNLPTTPIFLNLSVIFNTKSVAVIPSFNLPVSFTPNTSGINIVIDSPSITDSASMPPTPQPRTDKAFIIVV